MLTSQGDLEQIYVYGAGTWYQHLSVLTLPVSVDDTAWATSWHGAFYATDNGADTVDVIAREVLAGYRTGGGDPV